MPANDAGAAGGLLDFDLATQQAFNAAYWASFPPAIRQTFSPENEEPYETRKAKALAFAQQGYKLDTFIMLMKQDPYITMRLLQQFGFSSVPALGEEPVTLPPSLGGPSNAGSIKVSLNLADYPPYPVPVVPPASARMPVGPLLTGKTYVALMPESHVFANGESVQFGDKKYVFSFPSIFAPPLWILQG